MADSRKSKAAGKSAKAAAAKKSAPAKKAAKAPAKKAAKTPAKKAAPAKKVAPAKAAKAPAPAAAMKKVGPRADLGAPIDGFFARQPETLRPIVEELRKLVEQAAPTAKAALKWGMPLWELDGVMVCAIGAHKAHVNLILSGPPGSYADPQGLLEGEGKTGRHLRIVASGKVPTAAVRGWLRTAVATARKKPERGMARYSRAAQLSDKSLTRRRE